MIREGRRHDAATATRFLAVARVAARRSRRAVAEELGIAPSTVVQVVQRFCELGVAGLLDARRNNGARKVTPQLVAHVVRLLRHPPSRLLWERPTWTRELLCIQVERDGFPGVSVCTMGRILRSVGARLGFPKPFVRCPWPADRRTARLRELKELEARASAREPVLYVDEVDIHLNPRVGRDWMLRGHQRKLRTPGKNKKFYLAGAHDIRSGALTTTGTWRKDAALFCALLDDLVLAYPEASKIHLILDNFGIHHFSAAKARVAHHDGRIALHFLPPYCPDGNRIERVWQDLHANVTRNHQCSSLRALLGKARNYLDSYVWRRSTGLDASLAHHGIWAL